MSAEQRKRPARSAETRQPSVREVLAARAAADAVSTPPDSERARTRRSPEDDTADPTTTADRTDTADAPDTSVGAPQRAVPEAPPERRAA